MRLEIDLVFMRGSPTDVVRVAMKTWIGRVDPVEPGHRNLR
jgi:hypothetical protein